MNYKGSNQYKRKKHVIFDAKLTASSYFAIVITVISLAVYGKYNAPKFHLLSPISVKAYARDIIPTPTATPTPYQYDAVGAIKRIWGKDAAIGIAISSCESGTNPDRYNINTNGTIDFSVFQINTVHGVILDPEENIRYAYNMYLQQGTTPWNSSKHCWEKKL